MLMFRSRVVSNGCKVSLLSTTTFRIEIYSLTTMQGNESKREDTPRYWCYESSRRSPLHSSTITSRNYSIISGRLFEMSRFVASCPQIDRN